MRDPSRAVARLAGARRLDRLSALDVSNLRVEERGVPMHVAALVILEGSPLLDRSGEVRLNELRRRIERRLDRAPRLRQVLYEPRLGLGRPAWIDDAGFDVRQHVRSRAIPAPGDEASLLRVCAGLNEPPLDRSRPLWTMWFLTGLAGGSVGLLIRLHHALADGMAALALMSVLFDASPEEPQPDEPSWVPKQAPKASELLADNARRGMHGLARVLSLLRRPALAIRGLVASVVPMGRLLRGGFAARLSFNRQVGKRRRLVLVRSDLDRAKAVAHAHGAKVNDVVLASVAGGARRLLEHRGELTKDLVLKVSVPASMRGPGGEPVIGNLAAIRVLPVPVGEPDPIRRFRRIARASAEAKRHPPLQPGGRFAQSLMVRAMSHQRMVNLFTSNLVGPPVPLYLAGARLLEVFQIGVVQGNVPIAVGVISYAGELNFSVLGDADVVPDLDVFAEGMSDALDRLGQAHL